MAECATRELDLRVLAARCGPDRMVAYGLYLGAAACMDRAKQAWASGHPMKGFAYVNAAEQLLTGGLLQVPWPRHT